VFDSMFRAQDLENSQHKISSCCTSTNTIEMHCVENQVCVVLGVHTHGFQDPKHRINYARPYIVIHSCCLLSTSLSISKANLVTAGEVGL
jgi:hypothetical protein